MTEKSEEEKNNIKSKNEKNIKKSLSLDKRNVFKAAFTV